MQSMAELARNFDRVRAATIALTEGLEPEDTVVQTMADVSPTKWHLGHTTWFFETLVLAEYVAGYEPIRPGYDYLFNSYYNLIGSMHPRPLRGWITRPTLVDVLDYRRQIDARMQRLLAHRSEDPTLAERLILGCQHEQQHQELIVTDIKHVLAQNPLLPAWRDLPQADGAGPPELSWSEFEGGLVEIGHGGDGFAFDCERSRHRVWLDPYRLADRPVTNAEYGAFIADGGYRRSELWLADGWAVVQSKGWSRPLYWGEDGAHEFTVAGLRSLEPAAPVSHLSYFEADAYARWAGMRLPTEFEWENAAGTRSIEGNFSESARVHPQRVSARPLAALWGDVWEWTRSAFLPYPGFHPLEGALGEYNGKFMSGQMVLRGGSAATPRDHIRATYRNFFYPHQRWQFTGLRLADDA